MADAGRRLAPTAHFMIDWPASIGLAAQQAPQLTHSRDAHMATNKVAIVTGGGTGIGRAAALALQADGWDVVIAGRRKAELDKTVADARPGGGRMLGVPTDVSQQDQVKALFAKTKEAFGRLDFLFNNAGMGLPAGPMEDIKIEDWRKVVDLNLTACFMCAQEAIRIFKAQSPQGGRIVNNGSISAHVPRPMSVAYTSTKHAITGLTKCLALDGRPFNIAAGQIDIGNADTNMGGRMKAGVPQPRGDIMPEPVFDVEHCGSAIRYMASLPLDTNVFELMIKATNMPFEGRG
jgi:NAD(P)-dependent dehydrogenase (short-subunit alcohol dehydrogenase family)